MTLVVVVVLSFPTESWNVRRVTDASSLVQAQTHGVVVEVGLDPYNEMLRACGGGLGVGGGTGIILRLDMRGWAEPDGRSQEVEVWVKCTNEMNASISITK